eukprot:5797622-Prymnesium_polylepis.1
MLSDGIRIAGGGVRALQLHVTVEPEAVLSSRQSHIPRLVASAVFQTHRETSSPLDLLKESLKPAVSSRLQTRQMGVQGEAFDLCDALCRQYISDGLMAIRDLDVPKWHHKLLLDYFLRLPPLSASEYRIAPEDVLKVCSRLEPEVSLASRCGPQLAAAMASQIPYQELLFPGGSLDSAVHLYENSLITSFYN